MFYKLVAKSFFLSSSYILEKHREHTKWPNSTDDLGLWLVTAEDQNNAGQESLRINQDHKDIGSLL